MNGSVMRRRCRGTLKSPSVSDTEYFSDNADHVVEQPSEGGHSSLSDRYASEVDSAGDESDGPAASRSALPPTASQPSGELEVPNEADMHDAVNERAWYEFDLSLVLALLSPIANWLTGSDYVKNILLLLLLVFYLHQIIEVPWRLYQASRPRRALHTLPKDRSSVEDNQRAALSELHTFEIFYLALSVLSPILGATLLRTVIVSFAGPSAVSWFSLSLFVLATGVRPWKHSIQRLRQRATDLHTIIHYPPSDVQKMAVLIDRIAQLETELKALRKQSKSFNSEVYGHVEDAIEMMEIAARRQEKKAEVSKSLLEERMTKLEQNVEALIERVEIGADRPALYRTMAQFSLFVSAWIDYLSPVLPTWVVARNQGNVFRSPRSSPKMGRSRSSTKLETIPEVATFQPKYSGQSYRYFRIPGFGLALRIGDLATLPLRRTVTYLLAGQIYTPRTHASSS